MIVQLDNKVFSSFVQWFDHTLLDEGEAYLNKSSDLYAQVDPRLQSLYKYASPHKQWVSDSSISGADIPSGALVDSVFTPFTSSFFPDWENGRIISTAEITDTINVSYATKNFNIYATNQSEEKLLFQNRYEVNPFYSLPASGIAPYEPAIPACFLTFHSTQNDPYSMGSSDFQEEKFKVRAVIMTNSLGDMDACTSIFRRQRDKCLSLIDPDDYPYNAYGGFKSSLSGVYDYDAVVTSETRELIHIEKVESSKFFAGSHEFINQALQISFINFDLAYFRSP